ncbi:MAG: hypothetical protein IJC68_04865 [Firmicutes bacterium]|nr:hypothetical protein [Bacillota bacterium]
MNFTIIFNALVLLGASNYWWIFHSYELTELAQTVFIVLGVAFLLSITWQPLNRRFSERVMRNLANGNAEIKIALYSISGEAIIIAYALLFAIPAENITYSVFWTNLLYFILVNAIVYFSGIIRLFAVCPALRPVNRIPVFALWWIPIVNLLALQKVIEIGEAAEKEAAEGYEERDAKFQKEKRLKETEAIRKADAEREAKREAKREARKSGKKPEKPAAKQPEAQEVKKPSKPKHLN